jgi:hypothetical protein
MTRILLIIIILLFQGNFIPDSKSCARFSPDYHDFQLRLFRPELFSCTPFCGFEYSYHGFHEYQGNKYNAADNTEQYSRNQNIHLWANYIGNQVDESKIYFAVYDLNPDAIHPDSQDEFICALYELGKLEAIDYLKFAKKITDLNSEDSRISDPWEKGNNTSNIYRHQFIQLAQQSMSICKDAEIIRRYAFQCIRLAHYNGDSESVASCFNEYFDVHYCKDIIDYWSLYYIALAQENLSKRNFLLSQVFSNAPDKMFISSYHYVNGVTTEEVLAQATTQNEKANIFVLSTFKNPGKSLEELKKIHKLNPQSNALPFLVLREINKLEDWILTPYYTKAAIYRMDEGKYDSSVDKGLRIDRQYAATMLEWVNKINLSDPQILQSAKIDLNFLLRNFDRSLALIQSMKYGLDNENPLLPALQKTEMMATIFKQTPQTSCVPEKYQSMIQKMYAEDDNKILFMLAREFEYKGCTTLAAKFFSKVNNDDNEGKDYYDIEHAFWKSKKKTKSNQYFWFDKAFQYFDSQYNIDQMTDLISDLERKTRKSAFENWLDEDLVQQLFKLHDLLGTMHIRKNQLSEALHEFREVPESVWNSDDYPYNHYLNCNSFYTNFYQEHEVTAEDSVRYNKVELAAHLIDLLKKSKNSSDPNRDKYLFSVANCYFNMTKYGNSWMMRRYYWSTDDRRSNFNDSREYLHCDLAKKYYLEAKAATRSKKFGALCLRMAGRCEKYALMDDYDAVESNSRYSLDFNFDDYIFHQNKLYQQLKKEYPDDYQELISNCYSFGKYYAVRR